MMIKPPIAVLDHLRNPRAGAPRHRSYFASAVFSVLLLVLLVLFAWAATGGCQPVSDAAPSGTAWPEAGKGPYHHLIVLGDPHLPGKHIGAKERVLRKIDSWADLEGVIAVGDLCADRGSQEEYAAVKAFFGKLGKSLQLVAGNHDALYEDLLDPKGKRVRANPETIERKLRRFRETFGLPAIHDARKVGPYLLVFLSTDRWESLAGISETQLGWLRKTLEENPRTPPSFSSMPP